MYCEKEKEFKHYCKFCDFGTFQQNVYNKHCLSKKHELIIKHLT